MFFKTHGIPYNPIDPVARLKLTKHYCKYEMLRGLL